MRRSKASLIYKATGNLLIIGQAFINDQQMEFFGMCDLKLIWPDWGTRLSVGKHKGNGLCFIGHEASLRNK
jgi:hypothetical protein